MSRIETVFVTPIVGGGLLGYGLSKYLKKDTKKYVVTGVTAGVLVDTFMLGSVIYSLKKLT